MSNNLKPEDKIKLIRNIAIVAHVDHGKTTLVDTLLQQSGTFAAHSQTVERVMDSNDLEKERGITILSKNTGLKWKEFRINIVDTPGHADFGGEVERVLSMVDSVLLLVDAVDGPMPQTGFVTKKALQAGLRPIVVINKIDRDGARPDWVLDQTFDLFDRLGADEDQLDFPVVYASAIQGWATDDLSNKKQNMDTIFETIIKNVDYPNVDPNGDLQIQISALSYSSYVGLIGTGRIRRGQLKKGQSVSIGNVDGDSLIAFYLNCAQMSHNNNMYTCACACVADRGFFSTNRNPTRLASSDTRHHRPPGSKRAVTIGATASQPFVTGSNRSTVLTGTSPSSSSSFWPPAAYSLPSSTATPRANRAVAIGTTASHAFVVGSYRSTELRSLPSPL